MRSKQFTHDIIDTLGKRLFGVLLPIPKDTEFAGRIAAETRNVIDTRAKLRDRTKEIPLEVEGETNLPWRKSKRSKTYSRRYIVCHGITDNCGR
jgi:hypothetical protein